jgi:hypothetical protein
MADIKIISVDIDRLGGIITVTWLADGRKDSKSYVAESITSSADVIAQIKASVDKQVDLDMLAQSIMDEAAKDVTIDATAIGIVAEKKK